MPEPEPIEPAATPEPEPEPVDRCVSVPEPEWDDRPWLKTPKGNFTRAPWPVPTCDTLPSYQRRLTFDWPTAERDALREALIANRGLVLVSSKGCAIDVLDDCHADRKYEYGGWKTSTLSASLDSEYELWANLPSRAAVDTAPVEIRYHEGGLFVPEREPGVAPPRRFHVTDLELTGNCETATHVVVEVLVGAGRLKPLANSGARVEFGRASGCLAPRHELLTRAKRGCLEPYSIALVPLDPRAPYFSSCVRPCLWTGLACEVDDASCIIGPYHLDCTGERVLLEYFRPEQLDGAELPCTEADLGLRLTLSGPFGRITEVCGATRDLERRAAELFELALPVTREWSQHFVVEACPPVRVDPPTP